MILIACYYELTYTIKIKADKISYKVSFVKAQLNPYVILLYAYCPSKDVQMPLYWHNNTL